MKLKSLSRLAGLKTTFSREKCSIFSTFVVSDNEKFK